MELKGKTAVVTGGARGIGKAVALKLAGLGANVAICDIPGSQDAPGDGGGTGKNGCESGIFARRCTKFDGNGRTDENRCWRISAVWIF